MFRGTVIGLILLTTLIGKAYVLSPGVYVGVINSAQKNKCKVIVNGDFLSADVYSINFFKENNLEYGFLTMPHKINDLKNLNIVNDFLLAGVWASSGSVRLTMDIIDKKWIKFNLIKATKANFITSQSCVSKLK